MKTMLAFYCLTLSALAVGDALMPIDARAPVIEQNLIVMNVTAVSDSDRIAQLGELAVLDKAAASGYAVSTSARPGLLVVRDPMTGAYGTSDGGMIVRLVEGSLLQDIARDYGLFIKQEFSSIPMGTLEPTDRTAVVSYLELLNKDPRVVFAELDVNFYEYKTN